MVTIRNLISNVAPGQSSLATRYILQGLNDFYNKIKTDIMIIYAKPELGGTLVYFKVPSERYKNIKYDIVVWFDTQGRLSLETPVKVYSNSPGFAYNFVYVLNKAGGLLFQEEFPKDFLRIPPNTRNPLGTKAFDKHAYSAIKLIGSKKSTLESLSDSFASAIEPTVKSLRDKQEEINNIDLAVKKKKK
jgi:hypothetical protein